MKIGPVVRGALTFIPGHERIFPGKPTGGSDSASYCYGVWFKHLSFLFANGLGRVPGTLAELGPGDSIGIGLAAMLSGVDRLYTLDIVRFSNKERNLGGFR